MGARCSHHRVLAVATILMILLLYAALLEPSDSDEGASFLGVSSALASLVVQKPIAVAHRFESWSTLPSKRTLVVQFVSVERIEEFNHYWESHETRLMVPTSNASLLLGCPYLDESAVLTNIVQRHNWTLVKRLDHPHPLAHGPLSLYRTGHGVEVLFQPIIITLPRYYMNNPTAPICVGSQWSLSYAMYSGAVFSYHLIQLPVLVKYAVFVKVDTDIEFKDRFPVDIGQDMTEKRCLVGHTAIHTSSDCERGSVRGLANATAELQLTRSKSIGYEWCNTGHAGDQNSLIFYGNLIAFSTELLLHPDILSLSKYLFEEWQDGYFAFRWGDQAPFVMYVCHLLDVPDIHKDPQICDYSKYRDDVFVHY